VKIARFVARMMTNEAETRREALTIDARARLAAQIPDQEKAADATMLSTILAPSKRRVQWWKESTASWCGLRNREWECGAPGFRGGREVKMI